MTVIVALETEDGVIMGGDSAGVAGWDLTVRGDVKVFTVGQFVMGFTSSFRMGQILQHFFEPPVNDPATKLDDFAFMVKEVIPEVRRCLADQGWERKKEERVEGGNFLVGYNGKVYSIECDFQVGIPVEGFHACGCGESYALGAMHATKDYDISDRTRIELALKAAESCSAGVRGPFTIIEQ